MRNDGGLQFFGAPRRAQTYISLAYPRCRLDYHREDIHSTQRCILGSFTLETVPHGFPSRAYYVRVMLVSPHAEILASCACGAVSVPRKNFGFPLVAALTRSSRCVSRLSTGRQYICGRIPPCHVHTFVTNTRRVNDKKTTGQP